MALEDARWAAEHAPAAPAAPPAPPTPDTVGDAPPAPGAEEGAVDDRAGDVIVDE